MIYVNKYGLDTKLERQTIPSYKKYARKSAEKKSFSRIAERKKVKIEVKLYLAEAS